MIAKLDKFYVNQYIITFRALQTIVLPHYFLPFCRDSLKTTIDTYIKRNKASDNTILFKVMQTPGVLVQKTDKPAIENPYFDTIAADHPMYGQFLNKETAGWCLQYLQLSTSPLLEARSQLQFKLIMYGKIDLIWQEPDWISILQQWAQNGLGIPNAAFALQDIEAPPIMGIHQQEAERYPIKISDFETQTPLHEGVISLQSPTLVDFQHHSFTFEKMVTSAVKRMLRLQFLYIHQAEWWQINDKNELTEFGQTNNKLLNNLEQVRIKFLHLNYYSQLHISQNIRKGKQHIPLEGYIGEIAYKDYKMILNEYWPILQMAQYTALGEHINYGNGWIKCYG